jgi:hypothetical protein
MWTTTNCYYDVWPADFPSSQAAVKVRWQAVSPGADPDTRSPPDVWFTLFTQQHLVGLSLLILPKPGSPSEEAISLGDHRVKPSKVNIVEVSQGQS